MKNGDIIQVHRGSEFYIMEVEENNDGSIQASNGLSQEEDLKQENCSIVCHIDDQEENQTPEVGDIVLWLRGNKNKVFYVSDTSGGHAWVTNGRVNLTVQEDKTTIICKVHNRQDGDPVAIAEKIQLHTDVLKGDKGAYYINETMREVTQQARDSWSGRVGEERAEELETYLFKKMKEYAEALDIPKSEILHAWEDDRSYVAMNYYQEANQPSITAENTRVFDTMEDLKNAISAKRFRCPMCEGVSSNPYECDSGGTIDGGKTCDWKVYGLFRDLGKGVFVFVKEKVRGETIFMPIAWEDETNGLVQQEEKETNA